MKQYLDLLRDIRDNGQREPNRTGIDTLTLPGAMLKFDLRDGFPAVTTKRLAFKAVKGELIGFLRGCTSAADFRALGFTKWDGNANKDGVDLQGNVVPNAWLRSKYRKGVDDLGRIYGVQWRNWRGSVIGVDVEETDKGYRTTVEHARVDQIAIALDQLRSNPESRRIVVNAWNPAELDQAALPPCHVLFQLLPRSDGTLHMTMYQRSCDMFLGVPFNIASYALLLELFAAWSGRTAATLTMFLADAHIYVNHLGQVEEQLKREPLPLPKLRMDLYGGSSDFTDNRGCVQLPLDILLEDLAPENIWLEGYQSHESIKADMAV